MGREKAKGGEFSLFVAWSSGAIVFSRFAMVAGFGFCLGSSTTNSRSLCCQHLGVGGRRHRTVAGINGHVICLSYLSSLGTCHTSVGWCIGMWRQRLLVFTSSRLWHICIPVKIFSRKSAKNGSLSSHGPMLSSSSPKKSFITHKIRVIALIYFPEVWEHRFR